MWNEKAHKHIYIFISDKQYYVNHYLIYTVYHERVGSFSFMLNYVLAR